MNALFIYYTQGIMRGMFSTPANNIAVLLMTRLLFNIRETIAAGHQRRVAASLDDRDLPAVNRTTHLQLTTVVYIHTTTLLQELATLNEVELEIHGELDSSATSSTLKGSEGVFPSRTASAMSPV